jgi:hypothetical protein
MSLKCNSAALSSVFFFCYYPRCWPLIVVMNDSGTPSMTAAATVTTRSRFTEARLHVADGAGGD